MHKNVSFIVLAYLFYDSYQIILEKHPQSKLYFGKLIQVMCFAETPCVVDFASSYKTTRSTNSENMRLHDMNVPSFILML